MAKVSVNLEDDFDSDEVTTKVRELAAPLPSVSKAKSAALKDAPRDQFSFTNVPNSWSFRSCASAIGAEDFGHVDIFRPPPGM